MAIEPVPGYGEINQSNAKEIYKAYRKGEIELDPAQKKYTEKFLSRDDLDEIDYEVAGKDGYNQIEDAKKADEHGGQGGNAVGVTGGNIAAIAATMVLAKIAIALPGFAAVAMGAAALACASLTIVFSKMFDNGYDDRTKANGNAEATNETIDNNTSTLEESMEAMNEDSELYKEQTEEYTQNVNSQTSSMAALKAQLADAQAAGDIDEVKRLKEQMQRLEKQDFGKDLEEMEETRAQLEEYQYANEMAGGVRDAGQTVSDFLKQGTALGVVAALNAVIMAAATVVMGLTAAGHMPKMAPFFPDAPASFAAKALYYAAAAIFGVAAGIMGTKTKKEFECGSSGRDMQGHVDTLTEMLGQQEGYIETTTEDFDETDEEASESQEKVKEKANKALANRGGGGKKPEKEEPEKPGKEKSAA